MPQTMTDFDLPGLTEVQVHSDTSFVDIPGVPPTTNELLQAENPSSTGPHPFAPRPFELEPAVSVGVASEQKWIYEDSAGMLEPAWQWSWPLQGGWEPDFIEPNNETFSEQAEFAHHSAWASWNEFNSCQDYHPEDCELQGFGQQACWQAWHGAEWQQPKAQLPSVGHEQYGTPIELDKLLPVPHELSAHSTPVRTVPAPPTTVPDHPKLPMVYTLPPPPEHSASTLSEVGCLEPPPGLSMRISQPEFEALQDLAGSPDRHATQTCDLSRDRETPSSVSKTTHGSCSRSQSNGSIDTLDASQLQLSAPGLEFLKSSFSDEMLAMPADPDYLGSSGSLFQYPPGLW